MTKSHAILSYVLVFYYSKTLSRNAQIRLTVCQNFRHPMGIDGGYYLYLFTSPNFEKIIWRDVSHCARDDPRFAHRSIA